MLFINFILLSLSFCDRSVRTILELRSYDVITARSHCLWNDVMFAKRHSQSATTLFNCRTWIPEKTTRRGEKACTIGYFCLTQRKASIPNQTLALAQLLRVLTVLVLTMRDVEASSCKAVFEMSVQVGSKKVQLRFFSGLKNPSVNPQVSKLRCPVSWWDRMSIADR